MGQAAAVELLCGAAPPPPAPPAVEVQSVLQIDVEEPETSENPIQSFDSLYLPEAHTAFGRDNIQYIDI